MPPSHYLHVAVCGAGAFGRNHIRLYREMQATGYPVVLAAIVDPSENSRCLAADAGIPHFASFEQCLEQVGSRALHIDAASVCVPTTAHFIVSAALLAAGIHVLIEKPIASSLGEADELIRLGRLHRRLIQVGHLERFNPAVIALGARVTQPMFFEAHRLSVFSPRALDVDVVLDLMIHDLDIVLQLASSPVREVHAVGLPILSSQVDIANVRLEFESGCVANFTASRVSTERVRKLRFFQPHQYVSVDYARQDLLVVAVDPAASSSGPPSAIDATFPGLRFDKPQITQGEPLRLEIEAFLSAVQQAHEPVVSGEQGRSALALALRVQAAMQAHADRAGLRSIASHSQS